MNIRCVGQRIVVKRLYPEERGGLLMPKDVQKTSTFGEVLHKGPDADWVEVGDIVQFGRYSGTEVKVDDKHLGRDYVECLYMNCEDILGVVEGVKPEDRTAQPLEEVAKV